MKNRFRILQIMIFVLISLSACQQEESSAEVLVKVGKRSLSYQEFREFFPDRIWDELNHSQKMKFLSRWIDRRVETILVSKRQGLRRLISAARGIALSNHYESIVKMDFSN